VGLKWWVRPDVFLEKHTGDPGGTTKKQQHCSTPIYVLSISQIPTCDSANQMRQLISAVKQFFRQHLLSSTVVDTLYVHCFSALSRHRSLELDAAVAAFPHKARLLKI
jgi:hypothetical protein